MTTGINPKTANSNFVKQITENQIASPYTTVRTFVAAGTCATASLTEVAQFGNAAFVKESNSELIISFPIRCFIL